jgi:MazG family protein
VSETCGQKFERLVQLMERLRAPDGCPWDREQTFDTIKPFTLEETYEVLDAIDRRDWSELSEELGDFLLQAVFYAQMAREAGHFSIADSLDAINRKLIRRHPHIFGDTEARTAEDVKRNWDDIKKDEHREKGRERLSRLDGIPRALPALAESSQISVKAAAAGFEWRDIEEVFAKLREELGELRAEQPGADPERLADELGDVLFTVVNIARWLKVDPEQALRRVNAKFRRRFAHVEAGVAARGRTLEESNIEEMESLWQEAKTKS